MEVVQAIALSMGVGWASGINLYASILVLGLLQNLGYVQLPAELLVVSDPLVLWAAGAMYLIEFFADKVPGVDTGWDAVHTFIRIPAGAVLAAAAMGDVSAPAALAAGLVGGTLAAGTHAAKAGSRALLNTSPEPFSNWIASLAEDVLAIAGLWTALAHPWLFLALLAVFLLLLAWALPRLWRGVRGVAAFVARGFRRAPAAEPAGDSLRGEP
jgi:hypothetical protein